MSIQARKFGVRSLAIQNSLGTRTAAGYLRNRSVSLEDALLILAGRVL